MFTADQKVGKYKIISLIGSGGMGEVFLAEDTELERKVALKVLRSEVANDSERVKRFIQEAKAASALNHPNIITIHEIGTINGNRFITTEFIKGRTLREKLENQSLGLSEILDITIQVVSALTAAHESKIIHRDIKPENIMIRDDGFVKVLDFGLAKLTEHKISLDYEAETRMQIQTQPGIIMGTVAYMSPEQAKGRAMDPRTDIFSLGAMLYEMLTRKQPFTGETINHTIVAILEKEPPPLSRFVKDYPDGIEKIIQKCLAKNPDARYQLAKELIGDLNNIKQEVEFQAKLKEKKPIEIQITAKTEILGADTDKTINVETDPVDKMSTHKNPFIRITGKASQTIKSRVYIPIILGSVFIGFLAYFILPIFWYIPPKNEAVKLFNSGTEALREGTYYKASKLFEESIKIDNDFPNAHAGLAEAWMELDYLGRAQSEMLKVNEIQSKKQTFLSTLYKTEESLYLEAINATVMRNFSLSIQKYQKIAEINPNEPHVYLDLGRAYEKNEELDNAFQNFEKAANMDQQYGAAFLRIGILNLRKSDAESIKNAIDSFNKAVQIYERQSNIEGVTESLYWKGILFNKTNDSDQARTILSQALQRAQLNNSYYQQIRILLQLSNVEANVQKTDHAKKYAEQAIELAQNERMETLATQGLIDLGNSFFAKTKLGEAEAYFIQALKFASLGEAGRNKARAQLSLASLRLQQDNPDDALKFIEESLKFYKKGGYYQETSRALVLKAQAMELKGEYDLALQAFNEQLEISPQIKDKLQIAISQEGIGKILANREQFPEAFLHFQKSYEIYSALNRKINTGYSLMYQANMLWKLGHFEEASKTLNQAIEHAKNEDGSYNTLIFWIYLNEARIALSKGESTLALKKAKEANKVAPPQIGSVESKITYAEALKLSGSKEQAKQICIDALKESEKTPDPKLKADAQLIFAKLLNELGDYKTALEFALRAQPVFSSLQQKESEWRVLFIAGQANLKLGNSLQAKDFFLKSQERLTELSQKWGKDAFESYEYRPDIVADVKILNEELKK